FWNRDGAIETVLQALPDDPAAQWGMAEARISLHRNGAKACVHAACRHCQGKTYTACATCFGKKQVSCRHCLGSGQDNSGNACPQCQGRRVVACTVCRGDGRIACTACRETGYMSTLLSVMPEGHARF